MLHKHSKPSVLDEHLNGESAGGAMASGTDSLAVSLNAVTAVPGVVSLTNGILTEPHEPV